MIAYMSTKRALPMAVLAQLKWCGGTRTVYQKVDIAANNDMAVARKFIKKVDIAAKPKNQHKKKRGKKCIREVAKMV